jgi:hypothetical protein
MTSLYIKTPQSISYHEVAAKNYTLSASQYKDLVIANKNLCFVRDFLSRPFKRTDLGVEVGSLNYIPKSPYYFIRTRALQEHSFLPEITEETALPVMPKKFVKMNLKEGDLLISKDSNIGEIVILDKDYPNYMTSGAIYRLPITERKYYLLAFIKHQFFREQLDFIVPKGATIRHAKTMFLDCKIPMPNQNAANTIQYVEILTQAIINKEKLIRQRHQDILNSIETELTSNQKPNNFKFQFPTYHEILEVGRLDTGLYCELYKKTKFLIQNYKNGYNSIADLGFKLSRGQNLQVSNVGTCIYTEKYEQNFYSLLLPTNFSDYGVLDKIIFFGNRKKLKTLAKGEIVFGAEATFRSIVICEDNEKFITNIHGITLYNSNFVLSIFVKCFLDFLVSKRFIDCIKVGGNGGSFAQKYWNAVPFPNFPQPKQEAISSLYYKNLPYQVSDCNLTNFLETDNAFNAQAGIYELDKTAKLLKTRLNEVINDIICDREVAIRFEF